MSLPPVSSRHTVVTARSAAVHGDGGGRGAEQPPGLGMQRCPRFRRSEATPDMAGGGGSVGGKDEEGVELEAPIALVLALPAMALLAVVSRLKAAVPRRARSCLPHAVPSSWWSCRIPVLLPPPPAKDPAAEEEGRMFPRPQHVRMPPSPYLATAAAAERPAKRCLHCDAAETPHWRSGPTGRGTLCNACGVWYSKTGVLPGHRPTASPVTDSLPKRPIWEPEVPGAIYLVRKSAEHRRPPRTEAAPAPQPRTTCLHCGSPETPKLTEGPMGRREVCNTCGVRYKKGRLLPECRPAASQIVDLPPESPIANSPPESPIWKPNARPALYLARKPAKQRRPVRMEAALVPGPRKKKKRRRSCVHCGSSETPQWREGPMGRGTLCNSCGVQYKQGRLLPECRPAVSQITDSPPESPIANSTPESPIWKPDARPTVYLARKSVKQRRPVRMEATAAPGPKKKKRCCVHCGSSETPQWREGPLGRGTLCNACGVRYKQGRLLPEYRPMASPTFVPSEHANSHRRVLELHRKRQSRDQHLPPPSSPNFMPSEHTNNYQPVLEQRRKRKCKDQHSQPPTPVDSLMNPSTIHDDQPTDAPGCANNHPIGPPSSLDSLLLNGPSAPLIVESNEFMIN